jgi:hypothetical protein
MHQKNKEVESILPSVSRCWQTPESIAQTVATKAKKRAKAKLEKAEDERRVREKAKEEAEGPARLHALLTGEGLEVLGCEVCGCPLRLKVCMNPGCFHVNPRAPLFIGVPTQTKEGTT